MELGCSMAKLHNAQLHVVHACRVSEFAEHVPCEDVAESKCKSIVTQPKSTLKGNWPECRPAVCPPRCIS